jgi:tetratricopeptide (TPR) repeat protein
MLREVLRSASQLPTMDVERLGNALLHVATAFEVLGDDEQQRTYLQIVMDRSTDPSSSVAALQLGLMALRAGDNELARSRFEVAVKSQDPEIAASADLNLYSAMQGLYGDDELDRSMLARLEHERASTSAMPWIHLARGDFHLRHGDHDSARMAYERAATSNTAASTTAFYKLGQVAAAEGEEGAAIAAFSAVALSEDGTLALDARLRIAEAAQRMGDVLRARTEYAVVARYADLELATSAAEGLASLDSIEDEAIAATLDDSPATFHDVAWSDPSDVEGDVPPAVAPPTIAPPTVAPPIDEPPIDEPPAVTPPTVGIPAVAPPVAAPVEATDDVIAQSPRPEDKSSVLLPTSELPTDAAASNDGAGLPPMPDDLRSTYDDARRRIDADDLDGAEAAFDELARADHPSVSPLAAFYLAWIAEARGDQDAAIIGYQQAMSSDHPEAATLGGYHLGVLRASLDDLEGACSAYKASIAAEHPSNPQTAPRAAVNLGGVLTELRRFDEALEVYKYAASTPDPDASIRGWWGQAVVHLEMGSEINARLALTRVMTSSHAELSSAAALRLGLLLKDSGHTDDAKAMYQWAIESEHEDHAPKAAFNLGLMLEEMGDIDGARAAFVQVVESGHADAAPRAQDILDELDAPKQTPTDEPLDDTQLTETIRSPLIPTRASGSTSEQIEHYRRQMSHGLPDDIAVAAFNLGVLHESLQSPDEARSAYQKAVAAGSKDVTPRAQLNLGALLESLGDTNGARVAYRAAFQSGNVDFAQQATFNLAVMKYRQGDMDGARRAFRHVVISRHPDMAPRAAFNLGILEEALGNVDEARKAFEFVLESGHQPAAEHARAHL